MTRIVYIAGWGRSGTTLVGNLLGQIPGFAAVGELHYLWQRGLLDGRQCGCGLPLLECPWWDQVLEHGFGGADRVDAQGAVRAQDAIHTRHAPAVLRALHRGEVLRRYPYAGYLRSVYDGVAATGARVIVDSSKFPVDALVAAGLPGYRVTVVHMVRDPRAVAFSWQRTKQVPDKTKGGGILPRVGLVRSTAVWQVYNQVISLACRRASDHVDYLPLRYEDFVADPDGTLAAIAAAVGEGETPRPRFDADGVELRPTHTAGGNPNRFRSGPVEIRSDDQWRQGMPRWRQATVAALSQPALARFGYRWHR